MTFPDSFETRVVLYKYNGDEEEVIVPDGYTDIDEHAFKDNLKIKSVVLPASVKRIHNEAFFGCKSLETVVLPSEMDEIAYGAFLGCAALKNIALPDGLTYIAEKLFCGCSSLERIVVPVGVTKIRYAAFNSCESLKEVVLPEGVELIKSLAFYCCHALKHISLPASLNSIEQSAFGYSGLVDITVPTNLTDIQNEAFEGCSSLSAESVTELAKHNRRVINILRIDPEKFPFTPLPNQDIAGYSDKGKMLLLSCYLTYGDRYDESEKKTYDRLYDKYTKTELNGFVSFIITREFTSVLARLCEKKVISLERIDGIIELATNLEASAEIKSMLLNYKNKNFSQDEIFAQQQKAEDIALGLYEETEDEKKKNWTLSSDGNGGLTISSYKGAAESIVVPASVKGKPVTWLTRTTKVFAPHAVDIIVSEGILHLTEKVFMKCADLVSIVIPSTITVIPMRAFEECYKLERITLPATLEEICGKTVTKYSYYNNDYYDEDVGAFDYCRSLKEIIFLGTREQWENVKIGVGNNVLKKIKVSCADE